MMREKLKKFFRKKTSRQKTKGQSLVELTLTLPVLLILLSGLTEFGFMLNYYLSLVDASREVARTFSNFDPIDNDTTPTRDEAAEFYDGASAAVISALEPQVAQDTSRKIIMDATRDEIIVSAYSIYRGAATLLDAPGGGEYHWTNNETSRLPVAEVSSRLTGSAPNTGVIVVEIFYNYHQVLKLPWLAMLPDPFLLHAYTIMPLSAAEPTP